MKKLLAFLLAALMLFALCACGGSKLDTVSPGVLTMATNATFPPYEYNKNDKIVGIDVDIAAAIAEKLDLELEIVDMEFDEVIGAVKNGEADIGMAGMTVTEERLQEVDFTDSYATGKQVIIVSLDSDITSVDNLFAEGASYTIGVQRNTTGDLYTTWDLEDAGLAVIDRYSKASDTVEALVAGKVDCVVIDDTPARAFVAKQDDLRILDTEYVKEEYAGAIRKDNAELYEAVNQALEELMAEGTVQYIIDQYITAD